MLHRLGLNTVADIAHTPVRTVQRAVGHALGTQLHDLAWGTDRRAITPRRHTDEPDKSMGADETFARDTDDREVILREVLRPSAKVATRLRVAGVAGRTITLRVRFADFTTITSRSDEHTSELQSLVRISSAVYCLNKTHDTHRDSHDLNQPSYYVTP